MNGNADALSRNPINDNKEKLKYLQVDENDTFMTSQEKMFSQKTFTRNKQENSKNEVRPSKRRNLNPEIVPDDVDRFSEISEAQILNIDSKFPEYFQEYLSEDSFSEIGKNILKYKNLFKNMSSRLIFMAIFLSTPVFSKKFRLFETNSSKKQKEECQEAKKY